MTNDFVAKNRRWLERYVRQLQAAMNLGHWTIVLRDGDPPDEDRSDTYKAAVWRSNAYLTADLYVASHETRDDLRASIVHELVHIHLRDYDEAIRAVERHINQPAYDILASWQHHEMERAVDAISNPWAALLPLPPEGKGLT